MLADQLSLENIAKKRVITINESQTIWDAVTVMFENRFRRLPVLVDNQFIEGYITPVEILKLAVDVESSVYLDYKIGDVTSRSIDSLDKLNSVHSAIDHLIDFHVNEVLISDNDNLIGIFTTKDLILSDFMWVGVPDYCITTKASFYAKPITEISKIDISSDWYNAAKTLVKSNQRYIFITSESSGIVGILTPIDLLGAIVQNKEKMLENCSHFCSLSIEQFVKKQILHLKLPILLTRVRNWMNARGVGIVPLYKGEIPNKVIDEEVLMKYYAENMKR